MASIHSLPIEMICHILSFLIDLDKLSFISCSKFLRILSNDIQFRSQVDFALIKGLPYFNRFTSVKYLDPDLKSGEFKVPHCIEEIYVSSDQIIPKTGVKAQKVVIERIERNVQTLDAEEYSHSCLVAVDLKHIQCREMTIKDIKLRSIIIFTEGLEKLIISGISTSFLILPDSLKILASYSDIIIKRMSGNLEELVCKGFIDIVVPFEFPKSLSTLKVECIKEDRIRDALLSCYRSLKLKSLSIALNTGLDFKCLETLRELHLKVYRTLERIPSFPSRLEKLCIKCSMYSQALPKFPETLKRFSFSVAGEYELSLPEFPSGLEILKLKGHFSGRINFTESIRKLTFFEYSHKIDFSKLRNLRILRIGNYNYELTGLCDGLEELIFERFSEYNKSIVLPRLIKKVKLPDSFDREIVLPDSLEEIIFGNGFNRKVILPPRVTKVIFSNRFNQEICLSDSLQAISLEKDLNKRIERAFSNLKCLTIGGKIVLYRLSKN
jgi:hypothetical protein